MAVAGARAGALDKPLGPLGPLGYAAFDADNHYYEALDSFTGESRWL